MLIYVARTHVVKPKIAISTAATVLLMARRSTRSEQGTLRAAHVSGGSKSLPLIFFSLLLSMPFPLSCPLLFQPYLYGSQHVACLKSVISTAAMAQSMPKEIGSAWTITTAVSAFPPRYGSPRHPR
jgi:hypothetical protein